MLEKEDNIKLLKALPRELKILKKPPTQLYYKGNPALLESKIKVSILGSREPNQYAKVLTTQIASALCKNGAIIVSGGALGIDILAHNASLPNTIMVSPSGLNIKYPPSNSKNIEQIYTQGLAISEYDSDFMPYKSSFLERNRIVVALGQCVIIPQANLRSGSIHSANLAFKLGIPIYVLPHRLGESQGTNALLHQGKAKAIYDINAFVKEICGEINTQDDEVILYCQNNPSVEDAISKYGEKITEYEIQGKLQQINGRIVVLA